MAYWKKRTGIPIRRILTWLGLSERKFQQWKNRYSEPNRHNGRIPKTDWIEDWEKKAILDYYDAHPLEGYRRLTWMMIDDDIVAVSESSVYRTLKSAGVLGNRNTKASKKGTGFDQPLEPHQHWHIDILYLNIRGTFYYMCSILDGFSRAIVHWEIRESMIEQEVEIIVQRAREKYPGQRPRIISDNGPQFVSRDFKEFVRECGMTHVRTSPYYPQSNGKLERYHRTIKAECIRPGVPLSLEDARRLVEAYVDYYNNIRLHSAIGFIAPTDALAGHSGRIQAERRQKLDIARKHRRSNRQCAEVATFSVPPVGMEEKAA